jgi:hypothetical protein
MATKLNFVYRSGALLGSTLPSYYLLTSIAEVTSPAEGDLAYNTATNEFLSFDGSQWNSSDDINKKIEILAFLVAAIIERGFGGL